MILTSKDKFKKLAVAQPLIELSKIDIFEKINELYPKGDNLFIRPFEKIGRYEVMKGFDITFENLLDFWNSDNDTDFIKLTAKTYLNVESLNNLPLFDCLRLLDYAKDVAVEAAKLFQTIKRDYTPEEIEAGIQDIKSSDFDVVDRYCQRNGIYDVEIGYQTEWIKIFKSFESDFHKNNFERSYNDVISNKYKNK